MLEQIRLILKEKEDKIVQVTRMLREKEEELRLQEQKSKQTEAKLAELTNKWTKMAKALEVTKGDAQ